MDTMIQQPLAEEFQDGYNPAKLNKSPEFVKFADELQTRMSKEAAEFANNDHLAKDALKIVYMRVASKYLLQNVNDHIKFNKLAEEHKIMKEALSLIKYKSPQCDCMDAPGIASEALSKVGE